jgi:hypothetical protein
VVTGGTATWVRDSARLSVTASPTSITATGQSPKAETQRSPLDRALVRLTCLIAGIGGLGMRLWVHTVSLGWVNSDEAISGLIAIEASHGRFRTFFWGQNYGGTLESIVMAGLMNLGAPATLVFAALPIIESLAISLLVYRVSTFRIERDHAAMAAALIWVFPASAVLFSTRSMLFYQPTIICGLLAIWAAESLVRTGSRRLSQWFGLGLAIGVGLWCSVQITFFVVPILFVLLRNRRNSPRCWGAASLGAVLGALPWLVYFVRHNGSPVTQIGGGSGSYLDHMRVTVTRGLPMALGLREPFSERWLPNAELLLLAMLPIVGAIFCIVSCLRHRQRRSPFVYVPIAFIPLHALAPGAFYVGSGRYFVYLAPTVAYMVAATINRRRWLTVLVIAAMTASSTTLWNIRNLKMAPDDSQPVTEFLTSQGIYHVYAHYWVAYKLAWESDGKVTVASDYERNPQWADAVHAAHVTAYVMFLPIEQDQIRYDGIIGSLTQQGIAYSEQSVGDYIIVIPEPSPDLAELATRP